jgi:hypothetical protein
MASAVTTDYLSSILKITMYDFDPDETAATDVSWQDMRDAHAFMCMVMRSVGTGSLSSFAILANADSAGGSTDATVKSHSLGSAPDAVGDYVFLECLASELPPLGTSLRYVSGAISLVTATDECVVAYVFGNERWGFGGLTADHIA